MDTIFSLASSLRQNILCERGALERCGVGAVSSRAGPGRAPADPNPTPSRPDPTRDDPNRPGSVKFQRRPPARPISNTRVGWGMEVALSRRIIQLVTGEGGQGAEGAHLSQQSAAVPTLGLDAGSLLSVRHSIPAQCHSTAAGGQLEGSCRAAGEHSELIQSSRAALSPPPPSLRKQLIIQGREQHYSSVCRQQRHRREAS